LAGLSGKYHYIYIRIKRLVYAGLFSRTLLTVLDYVLCMVFIWCDVVMTDSDNIKNALK